MQEADGGPLQGHLVGGDYRVSGELDGQTVSAARVGRVSSCSPALQQRVRLLIEMGEVFDYPQSGLRFTATDTGQTLQVILTLVRALDRPREVWLARP